MLSSNQSLHSYLLFKLTNKINHKLSVHDLILFQSD